MRGGLQVLRKRLCGLSKFGEARILLNIECDVRPEGALVDLELAGHEKCRSERCRLPSLLGRLQLHITIAIIQHRADSTF